MKALLVYFKGFVKDSILGPVFKLIEASFELSSSYGDCWNCRYNYSK